MDGAALPAAPGVVVAGGGDGTTELEESRAAAEWDGFVLRKFLK